MQLVKLTKNEIFCDSSMVARKFGVQHIRVVEKMKILAPKLEDMRVQKVSSQKPGFDPQFKTEQRIYHGSKYVVYLMNRDCFMLLSMRFDTKRARKWQGQFLAAFNAMENQILIEASNRGDKGWITARFQGKIARLEETDAIKKFVDYATDQGSKNAGTYYKHITNATYKALDLLVQKKPKLRDTLNVMDIGMLASMEHYAQRLLLRYMELGREYHDIYNTVRDDLVKYGKTIKNPILPE